MSDTSDPLAILDAIDRERGESFIGMIQANQVRRLRDEIVALRAQQEAVRGIAGNERRLSEAIAQQARDAALEEAAHECDEEAKGSGGEVAFRDGCETCAAAIRLLKEKH